MYESFYGLKEKPFSLLPDPAFLFLAKQHTSALAMLEYGLINQAGFTLITGDIGCGKTTLIRHLLNNIERNITVGVLSNTQRAIGELLQWVLLAFNLDYRGKDKVALYQTFFNFINTEYAKNRRTVLIIDEAQNLGVETLEELRMLSNVNADKDQVIQLILVGQPELRAVIARPELTQFSQRVAVDYTLAPLSVEQTRSYITHRVSVAGGPGSLFDPDACDMIYHAARGVPRLINVLCDTALVYGYADGAKKITAEIAREVIEDKADSIVFSNRNKPDALSKDSNIGKANTLSFDEGNAPNRELFRDLFSSLQAKK